MTYNDIKLLIVDYSGLEKDALHIHAALLLYLLFMLLLRQSRRSRLPWLAVLAVELVNEAFDLSGDWVPVRAQGLASPSVHEAIKDLWNTMLWPTVLLVLGRYTNLFCRHEPRSDEDGEAR